MDLRHDDEVMGGAAVSAEHVARGTAERLSCGVPVGGDGGGGCAVTAEVVAELVARGAAE